MVLGGVGGTSQSVILVSSWWSVLEEVRWLAVLVLFLLVSFGGSGGILGFVILVLFSFSFGIGGGIVAFEGNLLRRVFSFSVITPL